MSKSVFYTAYSVKKCLLDSLSVLSEVQHPTLGAGYDGAGGRGDVRGRTCIVLFRYTVFVLSEEDIYMFCKCCIFAEGFTLDHTSPYSHFASCTDSAAEEVHANP